MDIEKIEEIIKLLKHYDLNKIYIEDDNLKLEIENRNNVLVNYESLECSCEENINNKTTDDNNEYIIKSPLVGNISIFENKVTCEKYAIGDKIKNGQVLCTIEAMKMFNEITCSDEGIISEVFIKDNDFVEYDQPLFKIRKSGKKNV